MYIRCLEEAVMVVEVEGGGEKNRHKKLFHVGLVKAESSEEEGEEEGDEREGEKTRYLHFFSISLDFLTFSLVRLFSVCTKVYVPEVSRRGREKSLRNR